MEVLTRTYAQSRDGKSSLTRIEPAKNVFFPRRELVGQQVLQFLLSNTDSDMTGRVRKGSWIGTHGDRTGRLRVDME